MDQQHLINCGVTCNRIGEVFNLAVPQTLQKLLLGDLKLCTKRKNDEVHSAIFTAFKLNYRNEWWMEPNGEYTVFHQLWDDSLEAQDP